MELTPISQREEKDSVQAYAFRLKKDRVAAQACHLYYEEQAALAVSFTVSKKRIETAKKRCRIPEEKNPALSLSSATDSKEGNVLRSYKMCINLLGEIT